jgi:hypothetical protein
MYFVDETPIENEHDREIANTEELSDHLKIINEALRFISEIPRIHSHDNEGDLALLRLSIRCFNSGSGALKLARSGYFQQSIALIRDLVETTFFIDLFARDRPALDDWLTLPRKQREKKFSAFKVRSQLDNLDGFKEMRRAAAYKLFSTYGSHPSYQGHRLVTRRGFPFVAGSDSRLAKEIRHATIEDCTSR